MLSVHIFRASWKKNYFKQSLWIVEKKTSKENVCRLCDHNFCPSAGNKDWLFTGKLHKTTQNKVFCCLHAIFIKRSMNRLWAVIGTETGTIYHLDWLKHHSLFHNIDPHLKMFQDCFSIQNNHSVMRNEHLAHPATCEVSTITRASRWKRQVLKRKAN